jgi:hypothetical protein
MRGSNFLRAFSPRRFLAFINSRRLAGTAGIDHAFGVKCAGMDARHAMRMSHGGVPKMLVETESAHVRWRQQSLSPSWHRAFCPNRLRL